MFKMQIEGRKIGDGCPVFIIAEAGANWKCFDSSKKNYACAERMIDAAADAGADAIKFQVYKAEKLYVKNAGEAGYIGKKRSIYDIIRDMEMPYEWLGKLKEKADKRNIVFMGTPFDEASADALKSIGVSAYKIASYSISHLPLLQHIASFAAPVILSTGASDVRDIETAVEVLGPRTSGRVALMQCTAKYPAPLETINLRVIPLLKKRFGVPVGLSDHSREPYVAPLGAVALGADIIEKHFTLSNKYDGPDHGFAVEPHELKDMVGSIRKMQLALGDADKRVLREEKELYDFCRRKIYTSRTIKRGHVLDSEDLCILRSGTAKKGLDPSCLNEIIGKKTRRRLEKGMPVTWEEIV
jgi:N-acetylneuraminate synthase